MTRLSDEEVYRDYLKAINPSAQISEEIFVILVRWVGRIREEEPRINCGTHLVDYLNICDEDDDMDSFYGEDYPW